MSSDPKPTANPDSGVIVGVTRVEPHARGGTPMAVLSINMGNRTLFIQLDTGSALLLANKLLSFVAEITAEQLEKADKKKENPHGI